jgi:hypothetical protein
MKTASRTNLTCLLLTAAVMACAPAAIALPIGTDEAAPGAAFIEHPLRGDGQTAVERYLDHDVAVARPPEEPGVAGSLEMRYYLSGIRRPSAAAMLDDPAGSACATRACGTASAPLSALMFGVGAALLAGGLFRKYT